MAVTPTAVGKDKQRTVIEFLVPVNLSGIEIHTRMCVVYGAQNVITKSTVNRWVQRFKVRRTCTSDKS